MIPYPEAVAAILAEVSALRSESVTLAESDGRILARSINARLDLPRFDQSAMDGIGVLASDLADARPLAPRTLSLIGEIPAGVGRRLRLRPGCAVKVFTGSLLPLGADAVVVKEECRFGSGVVDVGFAPCPGDHIRHRGEELERGAKLLEAGTLITPSVLGLLAVNGIDRVQVWTRPEVTLITMGNEILGRDERLARGRIHDANGPALTAALQRCGAARIRRRHVSDDPSALARVMKQAMGESDVVITVGGASVGDHDHVKAVRARLGVDERFTRVAIKPGKPTIFGVAENGTLMFGLPGNPVSALVTFFLFVRPALRRMQGLASDDTHLVGAVLAVPLRKQAGLLEWVRGTLHSESYSEGERLFTTPTRGQGSHMLSGLAGAEVLIEFPADRVALAAGDQVRVRMLDW